MSNKKITGANLKLALQQNNKKFKDFIGDKIHKIDQISIAQKTVNTELDSCFCELENNYTPVVGKYVPFVKTSGSFEVKDGRAIIKPGQRVQINVSLSYTGNSSAANIAYMIKDYTNNTDIAGMNPYAGDKVCEYNYSQNCQYTNETNEDCEIGLIVTVVGLSDTLESGLCTMTVQEIGRSILIDPVEHVNRENGLEDTPVGHIISCMSNEAPKHYLICDGTEYNITDYPYLAQHFKDQFGSINYFGGDGVDTFAVPDLRGEFLRGTGTAERDTGSGAKVGIHQNGTGIPALNSRTAPNNTGVLWFQRNKNSVNNDAYYINGDKYETEISDSNVTETTFTGTAYSAISWIPVGTPLAKSYTTRPTNTSVLYCIKYEPTYFMNVFGLREETVLFEGDANVVGTYELADSVKNYDEIYVKARMYTNENLNGKTMVINTKDISDTEATNAFRFSISTASNVHRSIGFNFTEGYDKIVIPHLSNFESSVAITKIIGIKYRTTPNGTISSGPSYTEEELQSAITDIVTEIDKEEIIEEPVEEVIENEAMIIPEIHEEESETEVTEGGTGNESE